MKISFLIPSKNRLDLLKFSVASILSQNDKDFEIVISDNASSEDYKSYVDQISDDRIVYFRQQTPVSVTDNWRAAFARSTGDYVLMLGDDDALAPQFFETVRPFLTSDGPDILYLKAYHYCYPNVMITSPAGYVADVSSEFHANRSDPFSLAKADACDLALSILDFRHRFGLNAQHFLLKASFATQFAAIGGLYQSPYPDFFAAVVTFVHAHSILVIPKVAVIIGISPKSFGAYYFSHRQDQGYEFLDNERIEPEMRSFLQQSIYPGDKNNTNWLIAAEMARRAIAPHVTASVNVDRYRAIQIVGLLRDQYYHELPRESAIAELRAKLAPAELLSFDTLHATIASAANINKGTLVHIFQGIERQLGQYPSGYYSMIDIGSHQNILDLFNWLKNGRQTLAIEAQPLATIEARPLTENIPRKNLSERIIHYARLGPRAFLGAVLRKVRAHVRIFTAGRLARPVISLMRLMMLPVFLRLPPVRRLHQRVADDQRVISSLYAENRALKRQVEMLTAGMPAKSLLEKRVAGAEQAHSKVQIVVKRDEKQFVIESEIFDDFSFRTGDKLSVIPPEQAAKLVRTPEGNVHIFTRDGRGIRVPSEIILTPYMGYEIPEHLVRLTGAGPETLESLGTDHIANYTKFIGLQPGMTFLEIGSGIGRDAFHLIDVLGPKGKYIGIDVQRESIVWCQKNISRDYPNFAFHHFNAYHELHNPLGTKTTLDYKLPAPDRSVDRVALGSVLTHIFEDEAVHYMKEIARVLKPNGLAYVTFFLYSEEIVAASRTNNATPYNLRFEYPYGDGCFVNDATYPTGGVAYTEEAMQRMISHSGLRLARPYLKGYWSGFYPKAETDDGQDVAILGV